MKEPPVAILVAAGVGRRMGGDKLWIDFFGRPAWRWALDTLLGLPDLRLVALVVPADAIDRFSAALPESVEGRCVVVAGGAERIDSVVAGLAALTHAGTPEDAPVLVHDAARPGVTPELLESVLAGVRAGGAAIPASPVPDTLKSVANDGRVLGGVDRDTLVAAQTPQGATLAALRAALEEAHAWGRRVTDEAAALTAAGTNVRTVPGDPANRKLTEPGDEALLRGALAARSNPMRAHHGEVGQRVGIGFDAHRFDTSRPLCLGGLAFPGEPGLAGHSDGDAALHALIDALLGAIAGGDIGTHFPPADERWRDADSADLLRIAIEHLAAAGWRPVGVDLAIVAARPAIAERRDEMRARIASITGLSIDAVSVKGTTSDGLGFAGREGLAAYAAAMVGPR